MLDCKREPKYRYQYRSTRGAWQYFFQSTILTLPEYRGRIRAKNIPGTNTRPNTRFLKFTNFSMVSITGVKSGIVRIRRAKVVPPFKIRWIFRDLLASTQETYLSKVEGPTN